MRQSQTIKIISLIFFCLITIYWGAKQHISSFDDAYITYRYARNIAVGQGFVYNPGEYVLGTTTPLYALLLAGSYFVWSDLPLVSHVIGVLVWVISIPLMYGLAAKDEEGFDWQGGLAAFLMALNALALDVLGMETNLYVMLMLLTFYLYKREWPWVAAVVAGLAFVTRWDGILVVGVLLFGLLVKQNWRGLLGSMVISGLIIIPWLGYSQVTFGSIFPNTLFAKAGQGWREGLGGADLGTFFAGIGQVAHSMYVANRLAVVWLLLMVVGLGVVVRYGWAVVEKVSWWPVLLWTVGYISGYSLLGVLYFAWYYPPIMPSVILLVAAGGGYVVERVVAGRSAKWKSLVWIGLSLLCAIPAVSWVNSKQRAHINPFLEDYVLVGEWFEANTPASSSVATIEIGAVGYYSERTIVDTMGLVSPGMIGHLDSWAQTLQFAVNYYWPDYLLVLEASAWDALINEGWFQEIYHLEAQIPSTAVPGAYLSVYKRDNSSPPKNLTDRLDSVADFDGVLRLTEWGLDDTTYDLVDRLEMVLRFQANADIEKDYRFTLELLNVITNEKWALQKDMVPFRGGAPTTQWRAGDVYDVYQQLTLPPDVEAGVYRLLVQAWQGGEMAFMSNGAGEPIGYVLTEPIVIGGYEEVTLDGMVVAEGVIDGVVKLKGYVWERVGEDEGVLTVSWQVMERPRLDYTIFVHVVAEDGALVAQDDYRPLVPTSLWAEGRVVTSEHRLVGDGNIEGARVRVGMYSWPSLARGGVTEAGCAVVVDNSIEVGVVVGEGLQWCVP
ncbi:MAG TPA: hypothetical protein VLL52_17950 [Anaerolineae bacterium]|nr:hypothetical protein [Anaerolineae bacterium]